jgi:hypothetical protein
MNCTEKIQRNKNMDPPFAVEPLPLEDQTSQTCHYLWLLLSIQWISHLSGLGSSRLWQLARHQIRAEQVGSFDNLKVREGKGHQVLG